MNDFDLTRVLESKRAYRQQLATRPLAEKLRLLDELRARALAIQRASRSNHPSGLSQVGESSTPYDSKRRP